MPTLEVVSVPLGGERHRLIFRDARTELGTHHVADRGQPSAGRGGERHPQLRIF